MPVLSTISVEKDEHGFVRSEKFVTERGFELSIQATPGGLYEIIPHGGGTPPTVCNERFTSPLRARDALIAYVQSTDRIGNAQYPGKPATKEKVKQRNGPSKNDEAVSDVRAGSDN